PYPQAVPLKYLIDGNKCIYFQKRGRCKACQKFCPSGAVNFEDEARVHTIGVGSIILCPGFVPYNLLNRDTFSYSRHPNVVTSLEFERILSSSGPYQGHLARPSDQKEPERIAWLQCVGSRDTHHGASGYCSTVCCTYAIKEAIIAKEHSTSFLDAAIFYIDIRTQGKDFEKYYVRAKDKMGIRFVKSKISTVMPMGDTGNLMIRYTDGVGRRVEEEFDMVVLSVGLTISKHTMVLAEKLGIGLNHYGFAATSSFRPLETSRRGIYVCGAFHGPKDIPYSVIQASAAACAAGSQLAEARYSLTSETPQVPERVVAGDPPRVGVFVCNCGINIGAIVRVPEVAAYAKTLPYVAYVEENLFTCSQDTQDKIRKVIKDEGLNRVVVAACSPRTHEPLFQDTLKGAGLNKSLFEMANIRNQCSWVHANNPDAATEKAKDLMRMAVAKAARLEPLEEVKLDITQAALVIGGGVAGMTAALGLADQGYPVHLVEKENSLGGHGRKLSKTWKSEDMGAFVAALIQRVEEHPLVAMCLGATVEEAEGFVGNFKSTIKTGDETVVVEHGAVIMAIGAGELKPAEYHYDRHPDIFVSLNLDRAIATDPARFKDVKTAAFIQCVGSREPQRPYCSKVCCTHSIHSALGLKELNPDTQIYILYRDIRTYGEREDLYREARSKGIAFIRYQMEDKPQVEIINNKLRVTVTDQLLQIRVTIDADIITLASAIVPPADGKPLSRLYKLSINEDGFFQEAHAKLRPVDFATDGVYMAGLAHGPKPVEETIAQAQAAAAKAVCLLAAKTISMSAEVAYSNSAYCSGCGVCEEICPFGAASIDADTGKAHINPAQCKGCGLCVASCRSGALNLKGFDQAQTFAMIEEALAS
ncbi:MAG: CoB--CoM heterodisulfide reductase iron-sulfur subunit A family protein, partial [Desulfobacterales bacterium]|nr:CoB--CoM heterodisulfide reductase iron-sulfur subunit A family protein [Desulfobacterales bacterium]